VLFDRQRRTDYTEIFSAADVGKVVTRAADPARQSRRIRVRTGVLLALAGILVAYAAIRLGLPSIILLGAGLAALLADWFMYGIFRRTKAAPRGRSIASMNRALATAARAGISDHAAVSTGGLCPFCGYDLVVTLPNRTDGTLQCPECGKRMTFAFIRMCWRILLSDLAINYDRVWSLGPWLKLDDDLPQVPAKLPTPPPKRDHSGL